MWNNKKRRIKKKKQKSSRDWYGGRTVGGFLSYTIKFLLERCAYFYSFEATFCLGGSPWHVVGQSNSRIV